MELNREKITKGLECCRRDRKACTMCPYIFICDELYTDTLALIKELTEENERLNTLAELGNMRANDYRVMRDRVKTVKADTVRKMQSEIKKRCIKAGIYPAFVANVIEQVAKEMEES